MSLTFSIQIGNQTYGIVFAPFCWKWGVQIHPSPIGDIAFLMCGPIAFTVNRMAKI